MKCRGSSRGFRWKRELSALWRYDDKPAGPSAAWRSPL